MKNNFCYFIFDRYDYYKSSIFQEDVLSQIINSFYIKCCWLFSQFRTSCIPYVTITYCINKISMVGSPVIASRSYQISWESINWFKLWMNGYNCNTAKTLAPPSPHTHIQPWAHKLTVFSKRKKTVQPLLILPEAFPIFYLTGVTIYICNTWLWLWTKTYIIRIKHRKSQFQNDNLVEELITFCKSLIQQIMYCWDVTFSHKLRNNCSSYVTLMTVFQLQWSADWMKW
jgi:hypothetical protein